MKNEKLYIINSRGTHPEKNIDLPFSHGVPPYTYCYLNIKYYRYKLHTVKNTCPCLI